MTRRLASDGVGPSEGTRKRSECAPHQTFATMGDAQSGTTGHMRVLTWNLNARSDSRAQAVAIADLEPDLVALQEVTETAWSTLVEELAEAGLRWPVFGAEHAGSRSALRYRRVAAVISRWPICATEWLPIPAPEVVVPVVVDSPLGRLSFASVYVPLADRGDSSIRVATQEQLASYLNECSGHVVVAGDMNSPRQELATGEVVPFARKTFDRERNAELALMGPTIAGGLYDAFRRANGYDVDGRSWYWKRGNLADGYRLDHVFATQSLAVSQSHYVHQVRQERLSDHSALVAEFADAD